MQYIYVVCEIRKRWLDLVEYIYFDLIVGE